jgi:hypothetical protein
LTTDLSCRCDICLDRRNRQSVCAAAIEQGQIFDAGLSSKSRERFRPERILLSKQNVMECFKSPLSSGAFRGTRSGIREPMDIRQRPIPVEYGKLTGILPPQRWQHDSIVILTRRALKIAKLNDCNGRRIWTESVSR